MIVYKFGGASVRDAWGIRNLAAIAGKADDDLVIVVSAFGKTTNALESILASRMSREDKYRELLESIADYHRNVIIDLKMANSETGLLFENSLSQLSAYLAGECSADYDFEYDQVVSFGEVWSTIIVSGFLNEAGVMNRWVDIRKVLVTDNRHRDANIVWEESRKRLSATFNFSRAHVYLTQGFIGGTLGGKTTTLGREGSDYTAAVLANMLDATGVYVWKDVPGLLNADPQWLKDTERLPVVSYKEAVEMTFSGAKVIHPKTIRPLHNKSIPLYVKSFLDPGAEGTVIVPDAGGAPSVPVFVKKEDQIMISILPRDFSFAISENLSRIFMILTDIGIKVNLVQASAVSINICADHEAERIGEIMKLLGEEFRVVYNDNVEMVTIRHYTPEAIEKMTSGRQVMVEQRTRKTVRFVFTRPVQS
jgi:aspartate kinase